MNIRNDLISLMDEVTAEVALIKFEVGIILLHHGMNPVLLLVILRSSCRVVADNLPTSHSAELVYLPKDSRTIIS